MDLVKILAIDDIADNLVVLKALLTEAFPSATFISALSGKIGIELCLSEKPDVILTDIVMPGMDGYEVCQFLKANETTKTIPVIMVTAARTDKESRIKALEFGADAFLTKPVDESELTAQIRAMLRIKESEDRKLDEKERLKRLVEERTSQLEAELSERKRTEKALKHSEERFQMLFNQAPLGYQSLDFDGCFIEVNKQWLDILGFSREEVIGKWFGDFLSPEYQEGFRMRFPLFKAQGHIHSEFEMVHKNGSKLFIAFEGRIGYNLDGGFKQTHCILQDITQRKQTEEALHESEAQFREFFEKAADAIFIADIETGIIVDVNEAATRLTLKSYEQMIGIHQSQLHPPVKEDYAKETFKKHKELVKQKLSSYALENTIVRADGIEVPVEILAAEVTFKGKRCLHGTFRDITERKKSENEILESEAKYRYMFQHNPQPMWIYDHDTLEILEVNNASTKIYGYSREEFLSMTIKDIRPAEDIALMLKDVEESRLDENSHGEWRHLKKSGEIMNVEISAASIMFKGRKARHVLIIDITERKKSEELLRESNEFNQSLLKTIPFEMDIVDEEGNILFHNEPFENIFNKGAIGCKCWDIYRDDKKQCVDCPLHTGIEIGKTESYESAGILSGKVFEINHTGMMFNGKKAMLEIFQDITERKRAEENLKESQQLFQGLFNASPDAIVLIDPNHPVVKWQIVDCNEAACQMNGYKREELIGQSIDIINATVGLTEERLAYVKKLRQKGVVHMETTHLHKDGHIFSVEISSSIITIRGREFVLGIDRDITERKLAELALKESEDRYRSFISQVSEGVYRFESDQPMDLDLPLEEQVDFIYDHMYIAEFNDACLKMYGISDQAEIIGKLHLDFHGGRHNPVNRDALRKFISNGYRIENAITEELNALGQLIYISNNSLGIIENNQLVRMWGTQTDITEKVRADKVQKVLYAISNATLTSTDLTDLTEMISRQLGQLLDSTNFYIAFYDEASGMLSTKYNQDEMDEIDCWPAEKSATGYVIKHQKSLLANDVDVIKLCESGEIEMIGTPSKVWLGVPLFLNQKVIGAIVVQNYDNPDAYTEKDKLMLEFISHQIGMSIGRKKADLELKEALDKAQESDRLKSSFLANMSHEIRTPLNSIIGFSDLLLDPDFERDQHVEFARMINSSGNGLLSIISDIMDLSKIEAGQVELNKRVFSVHKLIDAIRNEYSFRAVEKGIELRLDPLNPEEEIFIESDESKVRQVLINFVGNAIKFTEHGFIEIGIRSAEDSVQIHVKDSGIGIPAEHHDKIFERFRQVESSSTRKYGGNGLGLAISKSLVEILKGEIGMESEQGKGSTFYFTVPFRPE